MAMSNRKVISRHLFSWQTFWPSRPVRRKQWLWKAFFHVAFSNSLSTKMMLEPAGWQIEAWANQSRIFTLRMFYSVPLGCRWFFRWWEEWTENMGFGWWFGLTHHRQKYLKSSSILLIQPWDRLNVVTLKDTKICSGKPFSVSISTFCIGTKENDDPRDADCTRNESAIASKWWTPPPMS